MNQSLLLRIHADSTEAGGNYFSPYFPKTNTFETIPIPEDLEDFVQNVRIPRYCEIRCANDPNLPLSNYIPANRRTGVTRNGFAHFDPNPISQTYGENIGAPVLSLCRQLKKGDLLVWSSALAPWNGTTIDKTQKKMYITGFFIIKEIVDFSIINKINGNLLDKTLNNLEENAHLLFAQLDDDGIPNQNHQQMINYLSETQTIILYGENGGQLKHPIQITDLFSKNQNTYPILEPFIESIHSTNHGILRNIGYWLDFNFWNQLLRNQTIQNPSIHFN